jgi:hypothetical protein
MVNGHNAIGYLSIDNGHHTIEAGAPFEQYPCWNNQLTLSVKQGSTPLSNARHWLAMLIKGFW